jgi:hypothetical protein
MDKDERKFLVTNQLMKKQNCTPMAQPVTIGMPTQIMKFSVNHHLLCGERTGQASAMVWDKFSSKKWMGSTHVLVMPPAKHETAFRNRHHDLSH